MYYQESAIIVASQHFIEEEVKAVDEYLFKNQERPIRLGRLSDFTDISEGKLQGLLDSFTAAGVLGQTSLPVCGKDDIPLEQVNEKGEYFCDLCERTIAAEKLTFEIVYIARSTKFECGDTIPIDHGGTPDVDGIVKISGCSDTSRIADIVFVHGLDGDAKSTWHPENHP